MPDLMDFVNSLLGPQAKPRAKRVSNGTAASMQRARAKNAAAYAAELHKLTLPHPLVSTRWHDESITLTIRELRCSCGAVHVSPCENVFIRRYHPQFGIHEVPIPLREWSPLWLLLPRRIERHEVPIAVCHLCFEPKRLTELLSQPQLFSSPEVLHSHASIE